MIKKWKKKEVSSIEEALLKNLEVNSTEDINNWYRKFLADDYKISLLDDAVNFVYKNLNLPIKIFGDFDVDGITSTSILIRTFRYIGANNISYRIPRRFTEGFGVNMNMVNEITEKSLIIIVDNGIAQYKEVAELKRQGHLVVVLDHHESGQEISKPDFLIDPEALKDSADFSGYCGAGLAFKFARKLLCLASKNKDLESGNQLTVEDFIKSITVLAMLGTIGDVMPLREENYVIVRRALNWTGMANLNPGLYALMALNNMTNYATAINIAYKIVPMFNACSRMDDDGSKQAVELLISEKPYIELKKEADSINEINAERKRLTDEFAKKAEALIEEQGLKNNYPIVLHLPEAPLGIIGIIAAKIMEKHQAPVFLVTDHEEEVTMQNGRTMLVKKLKGSGRGPSGYKISNALQFASSALLPDEFGGHEEGAAGLALLPENFESLKKLLLEDGKNNKESSSILEYDYEISSDDIKNTLEMISKFEPFGKDNPVPVFKIKNFELKEVDGTHKKLISGGGIQFTSVKGIKATGFGMANYIEGRDPIKMDLIATLSYNYWKGNKYPQVMIEDFEIITEVGRTEEQPKEEVLRRVENAPWNIK